jgi:hypothetical protein
VTETLLRLFRQRVHQFSQETLYRELISEGFAMQASAFFRSHIDAMIYFVRPLGGAGKSAALGSNQIGSGGKV